MLNDLLYILIFLIITPYYLIKSIFVPKYRAGLKEKFGFIPKAFKDERPTAWFHCVSVGETLASVELIKAFRNAFPEYRIAVSTTTATGREIAKKRELGDVLFYYPFDFSCVVKRVLKIINPRMLFLAELEVWPNMARICAKRNIPVAVYNGRITERSHKGYKRWSFLTRKSFGLLAFCTVQDQIYQQRFIDIGVPEDRVTVAGNLKYDALKEVVPEERLQELSSILAIKEKDIILLGGSTHTGEEKALLEVYTSLKPENENLRLVLVPRHPERLPEVLHTIEQAGCTWYKRTEINGDEEDIHDRILVIDTMGELGILYALCTIAYVGGSFSDTGGHNMLEPAIFKKPVIVGPSTFNFAEDMERLSRGKGIAPVQDQETLLAKIKELAADKTAREKLGENGYQIVQQYRGAVEKTMELIRETGELRG